MKLIIKKMKAKNKPVLRIKKDPDTAR